MAADLNRQDWLAEDEEVGGEGVGEIALCGTELDEEFAHDVAAKVVFLAVDFNEFGSPIKSGGIVGLGCIFDGCEVGRVE